MTVSNTNVRQTFAGNSSATVFPSSIILFEGLDARLWLQTAAGVVTALVPNVDFSVAATSGQYPDTVNITYPLIGSPLATGDQIIFYRLLPLVQNTLLANQGPYFPKTIEQEFDRLVMEDQQLQEQISRALFLPIEGTPFSGVLPSASARANNFLYFDGSGNPAVAPATTVNPVTLKTFSSIAALRLNATAAGSLSQVIGLSGFSTGGDGGGGFFTYVSTDVSSTDDGGTLIVDAAGQRWYRNVGDHINIKWYGAKGDGVADDQPAIQKAVNVALTGKFGRRVHAPTGFYKINSSISITDTIEVSGEGRQFPGTVFYLGTASQNGFVVTTANPCYFHDFQLLAPTTTQIAGAGFIIDAPGGSDNNRTTFRNLNIWWQATGISFVRASLWIMDSVFVEQSMIRDVLIDNQNNVDHGDSFITNCRFGGANGATCILYQAGGGLKITNCKFLGGSVGLDLKPVATGATADLLVSNCSFEGFTAWGIRLSRATGSLTFTSIVLTGLQFANDLGGIIVDSTAFSDVVISNCVVIFSGTSNGLGIAFSNGVTDFDVNNVLIQGPNSGTNTGLTIDASCSRGKISNVSYKQCATTYSNLSPSTTFQRDYQTGSTTATMTASAYGTALFLSSTVTVTFPAAFTVAPTTADIQINLGSGGVYYLLTAISTTAMQFNVIGTANSGTVTANWRAGGVI